MGKSHTNGNGPWHRLHGVPVEAIPPLVSYMEVGNLSLGSGVSGRGDVCRQVIGRSDQSAGVSVGSAQIVFSNLAIEVCELASRCPAMDSAQSCCQQILI